MNWYALHVRSCQEHAVAQKLANAGIEAFYPFRRVKSADKRRSVEQRFMPGYVFARFDLENDTPVVAIHQVVGIVGAGRHAIAIPDFEIEQVKRIVSLPEATACEHFIAGDRVRVRYGLLVGLEGYVLRWKKKAWVVVTLAGIERSIRAEVDPLSLESIPLGKAA
jgi:transcription antitermination factor NusG